MKFVDFLNEKTNNLNSAVDYIYKMYYSDFFKKLAQAKTSDDIPEKPKMVVLTSANLAKFSKNKLVQKLDKLNPVLINIETLGHGNAYNPISGNIYIKMSGFFDAIKYTPLNLKTSRFNRAVDYFTDTIPKSQQVEFKNDYLGNKLKNSIAHELNHWADDTLHNSHILNRLQHAHEFNQPLVAPGVSVATTDFEMDSQVHQIKQMKRTIPKKIWDSLTFDEMIKYDNSLSRAIIPSLSRSEYPIWRKKMLKRLARENLLGKNMTHA